MPILRLAPAAFDPPAIRAMSKVFAEVCGALQLSESDNETRDAIAIRIIEFARGGIIDADRLWDRVLQEYQPAPSDQGVSSRDRRPDLQNAGVKKTPAGRRGLKSRVPMPSH
jgi:hypothetical protein